MTMSKFGTLRDKLLDLWDTLLDFEENLLRKLKPLLTLLAILGILAFLIFLLRPVGYKHHPNPDQVYALYVDLVKKGDDAFSAYKYDMAQRFYREAESELAALIEFEDKSPSRDISLLQHYYNRRMLLKTRIELTLIAQDVFRLRSA